tara:strand:+ start:207 stop:434 length:228 start_codon:yes stop_codon:yes gene_type:complete
MYKIRFHNSKITDENLYKKQRHQTQNLNPKIVVDINKLLNRVKLEEKNETKRKIIFFSLAVLGLSFAGTLLAVTK